MTTSKSNSKSKPQNDSPNTYDPNSDSFDIEGLQEALNNSANEPISNLTHAQIKRAKNDILQKLQIKGDALKTMHARLVGYRYIDNDCDNGNDNDCDNGNENDRVRVGEYVRWISLKRPDHLVLTNGAYVCNAYEMLNPSDPHSAYIRCKISRGGGGGGGGSNSNFAVRFFNLNMDENVIFQKITYQEWIILDALEHLK